MAAKSRTAAIHKRKRCSSGSPTFTDSDVFEDTLVRTTLGAGAGAGGAGAAAGGAGAAAGGGAGAGAGGAGGAKQKKIDSDTESDVESKSSSSQSKPPKKKRKSGEKISALKSQPQQVTVLNCFLPVSSLYI